MNLRFPRPLHPPPATPAHVAPDLLSTVLAKLDRIEKLLEEPPVRTMTQEQWNEEQLRLNAQMPDPDRSILPLDIDADLLQRFERYCAAWKPDVPVSTILIQLIEDFMQKVGA